MPRYARLVRPVAMVVIAVVAGYLIARSARSHSAGSDALSRTAVAPTFRVRYPDDWTRGQPPELAGLALRHVIGIHPTGSETDRLAIGTMAATTVGALPRSFLASLPARPQPQTVRLGSIDFDRYLYLRPRGVGGVVSVYLLATTRATIVATCAEPRPIGTFAAECERVLRTLTLAPGVRVSGGVDAAYALELNQILATLNQYRKADGPGLLAASLDERAGAADQLAAAEARAARSASRLSTGAAASANATLVAALRQAAGGYRALATAARARDESGYEAAQRTLRTAQRRLQGAFTALSRLGYRLS